MRPILGTWLRVTVLAFLGICVSLVIFVYAHNAERQRLVAKFEVAANQPILQVNNLIQTNLATVQSLAAFYESSEFVTRQEFKVFSSSILSWHKGVQALEWLPRVEDKERSIFELAGRQDGQPNFQITEKRGDGKMVPAASRSEYFPVYYVEPLRGNEAALGFDVMSEETRSLALARARQAGQMAVSEPIILVQSSSNEYGVLVAAPVVRHSRYPWVSEWSEDRLEGFVLAVLQIPKLIGAAIHPWMESSEFGGIYVYANLAGKGKQLIFAHQPSHESPPVSTDKVSTSFVSEMIQVADQQWEVVIMAPPGWPTASDLWLPRVLLFFLLSLTAVASVVDRMRLLGKHELERLAGSLRAKNRKLELVSKTLARYLPRQVWDAVMSGHNRRSIGARRKPLTIFFGDIVDFTRLSNEMHPDELTFILNDFFSEMSAIGQRYGATLDKYVGDAVIMFFGDPISKGVRQDAVSCVLMAIEMQQRMSSLRKKWRNMGHPQPLHMRMGIHSGTCNVGNFGSKERMAYTIVGLDVNITAFVEKFGKPDEVTITGETHALVKGRFECTAFEQVHVKGITRDVQLFSVNVE
ncbi:CHASE domain-containing protein [Leisingera sp. JC11]|uniref:CHASE domain-containing protein n=1 Tax=Leisingera sp. JC11 TaxID=3042469 RepID=UPI003451E144